MIIRYLNPGKRTTQVHTVTVGGEAYDFQRQEDGTYLVDVEDNDHVLQFLKHEDLYALEGEPDEGEPDEPEKILPSDILEDLDALVEFANSQQDEIRYTRRNSIERILGDLKANGYTVR